MARFQDKREKMGVYDGLLVPKVLEKLEEVKEGSKKCIVIGFGFNKYEVIQRGTNDSVDLEARTLVEYGNSQVSLVSMQLHVFKKRDIQLKTVHKYYHKSTYLRAYAEPINPLSMRHLRQLPWVVPMIPPVVRSLTGRKPKSRKKQHDETSKESKNAEKCKSATVTCGKCKTVGHNTRSCKNPYKEKVVVPKGKPGRPRLSKSTLHVCHGDPSPNS